MNQNLFINKTSSRSNFGQAFRSERFQLLISLDRNIVNPTKMDQIPLQTLKPIEKVSTEDQINNLIVEVASVNRNFKPTVRSRREYEPDDTIDFDSAFEKVLNKIDSDVENIHLTETLPKIETELNLWVNEYKSLLEEFHKLREDNVRDQVRKTKTLKK